MRYDYKIIHKDASDSWGERSLEAQIVHFAQEGYRVHTIDFLEQQALMERCKAPVK